MLTCTICNTDIGACVCPERDDQLRKVAYNPNSPLAFKWCRGCDKHYARCRCETPQFYVLKAGQELAIPDGGWHTAAGTRVIPDLTQR